MTCSLGLLPWAALCPVGLTRAMLSSPHPHQAAPAASLLLAPRPGVAQVCMSSVLPGHGLGWVLSVLDPRCLDSRYTWEGESVSSQGAALPRSWGIVLLITWGGVSCDEHAWKMLSCVSPGSPGSQDGPLSSLSKTSNSQDSLNNAPKKKGITKSIRWLLTRRQKVHPSRASDEPA